MAKAFDGKVYASLHRRCVVCDEAWTAPHPQDRNIFCPECQAILRKMIMEKRGKKHGEVQEG